jgi:hypothetical protein
MHRMHPAFQRRRKGGKRNEQARASTPATTMRPRIAAVRGGIAILATGERTHPAGEGRRTQDREAAGARR